MGQVPGRAALLLIGDGRLASHLSHYFRGLGLPLTRWSRRQGVIQTGEGSQSARSRSPRDARGSLPELLARADRVLLAIRDDALPGFVQTHRRTAGTRQQSTRQQSALWVHFSGSTVVDDAWSAHPLCTFSGAPYAREVYESIPFIVEREGPPLAELVPGLPNPTAAIPRAEKALYHALCVAAGNFTQMLWGQLFDGFEKRLDLPPGLALPYLRQTARRLERSLEKGESAALTGPVTRGDHGTIHDNLEALNGAGLHDLAAVYEAFLSLAGQPRLEDVA